MVLFIKRRIYAAVVRLESWDFNEHSDAIYTGFAKRVMGELLPQPSATLGRW